MYETTARSTASSLSQTIHARLVLVSYSVVPECLESCQALYLQSAPLLLHQVALDRSISTSLSSIGSDMLLLIGDTLN